MAAILKIVKCMAIVWLILVNFGTAMHIRPPNLMVDQKLKKIENTRWQMAAILKIEKLQYLQNFLADFDEILRDGTY